MRDREDSRCRIADGSSSRAIDIVTHRSADARYDASEQGFDRQRWICSTGYRSAFPRRTAIAGSRAGWKLIKSQSSTHRSSRCLLQAGSQSPGYEARPHSTSIRPGSPCLRRHEHGSHVILLKKRGRSCLIVAVVHGRKHSWLEAVDSRIRLALTNRTFMRFSRQIFGPRAGLPRVPNRSSKTGIMYHAPLPQPYLRRT